jgi:hypothetical protein
VITILDREELGPFRYEQISGNIHEALTQEKFGVELDRFITTLRDRSEIEINRDRLAALRIEGTVESAAAEGDGHGAR